MRRVLFMLAIPALLLAGCGNKMDLPVESETGAIPFDGYFVASVWENMGSVTDILITENQWLYMAEDSATVKRYKRKGANDGGVIVAREIERIDGLTRPISLDEGMEDHIFILDLADSSAVYYTDRPEPAYFTVPAVIPMVRLFDLFPNTITDGWTDPLWAPWDSTETLPGRDSVTIHHHLRLTDLTGITADGEDRVFVSGKTWYVWDTITRDFDTLYADGTDSIIGLEVASADTATVDSTSWFVNRYDSSGELLGRTVGTGSGAGYGVDIPNIAAYEGNLYFIDRSSNRIKANDAFAERTGLFLGGLEWLDGSELPGENDTLFSLDPSGLAVDPVGDLYVSDGGFISDFVTFEPDGRILKYTSDFLYLERVDMNGSDLVTEPGAIAATDSLVYVFDESDRKIVLFELPKAPE